MSEDIPSPPMLEVLHALLEAVIATNPRVPDWQRTRAPH